jgi:hypothetical protein
MYTGCYRISHSSEKNDDYCLFKNDSFSRPANKSQASSNEMVGGAMVGGTGVAISSQLGYSLSFLYFIYFIFFFSIFRLRWDNIIQRRKC